MVLTTNAGTPIVNAQVDGSSLNNYLLNDGELNVNLKGQKAGLAAIRSTRTERGFWQIETDVDQLIQGATLRTQYTYVIKNAGSVDYLSKELIEAYENKNIAEYTEELKTLAGQVKNSIKTEGYDKNPALYLGEFYYTGTQGGNDREVLSKVEKFEEYINNDIKVSTVAGDKEENERYFNITENANETKKYYDTNGVLKDIVMKTKIENKEPTGLLKVGNYEIERKIWVSAVLSSAEQEITYPSYMAQVIEYSNAAGRRDYTSAPANLTYVHNENNANTLADLNEPDEFWGETISVRKPTGQDKAFPVEMVILATSSILLLGAGIMLIKKYVVKK